MKTLTKEEFLRSMNKLSESSELAKEFLGEKSYFGMIDSEGSDFHPNGNCGCVELDDDYLFGIRCDHLMWMEGNVEDNYLWTKDLDSEDARAILVCGNHKGLFMSYIILPCE